MPTLEDLTVFTKKRTGHRSDNLKPSAIDRNDCWHSNRRLPFIVCQLRKTNFSFPFLFAANKRKIAVSVTVCRKQTKVAVFRKFCFQLVPFFFREIPDKWRQIMETYRRRHGNMETWKHGTWWNRDTGMETRRHETENGSPGDFPYSVYRFLIMQTEICRLSVCWQRIERKLSFGNRLAHLCHLSNAPMQLKQWERLWDSWGVLCILGTAVPLSASTNILSFRT